VHIDSSTTSIQTLIPLLHSTASSRCVPFKSPKRLCIHWFSVTWTSSLLTVSLAHPSPIQIPFSILFQDGAPLIPLMLVHIFFSFLSWVVSPVSSYPLLGIILRLQFFVASHMKISCFSSQVSEIEKEDALFISFCLGPVRPILSSGGRGGKPHACKGKNSPTSCRCRYPTRNAQGSLSRKTSVPERCGHTTLQIS
jgi:hypothetical protein